VRVEGGSYDYATVSKKSIGPNHMRINRFIWLCCMWKEAVRL